MTRWGREKGHEQKAAGGNNDKTTHYTAWQGTTRLS